MPLAIEELSALDPTALPAGARARLGNLGFRHGEDPAEVRWWEGGARLLVAGAQQLWLFDRASETPLCRARPRDPGASFVLAALSPDERFVLAWVREPGATPEEGNVTALVWELATSRVVAHGSGSEVAPTQTRVSDDGRWVALAFGSGDIEVRSLPDFSLRSRVQVQASGEPLASPYRLVFSADGRVLVVFTQWNEVLEGPPPFVRVTARWERAWALDPADGQILSRSPVHRDHELDGAVVFEALGAPPPARNLHHALPPPRGGAPRLRRAPIQHLRVCRDGSTLLVNRQVVDPEDRAPPRDIPGPLEDCSLGLSPHGERVYILDPQRGILKVLPVAIGGARADTVTQDLGRHLRLALFAECRDRMAVVRRRVSAFRSGRQLRVMDLDREALVMEVDLPLTEDEEGDRITCGAFSPEGDVLFLGSAQGWVETWDLPRAERVAVRRLGESSVAALAVHPSGRLVAARTLACAGILLRDERRGGPPRQLELGRGAGGPFAFRPTGEHLAVGDNQGAVRLYELQGLRSVQELRGHHGPVLSLAFSPDGGRLYSGGQDGTVVVWSLDALEGTGTEAGWTAVEVPL